MNYKNKLLIAVLLTHGSIALACADVTTAQSVQNVLIEKLNKFDGFTANFSQKIFDADGNLLQDDASGTIDVKRPNLFKWHTQLPDENLVVSNGETLWMFDPFVGEAHIYNIDDAIVNSPMVLLSSNDITLWQQYSVIQRSSDEYVIDALDETSQVKQLIVRFADSVLSSFTIVDSTEQTSTFDLSQVQYEQLPDNSTFTLTLPKGISVIDKRNQ